MNRYLLRCTSQRREQTVMHLRLNLCQYRLRAGIEYCLLWLRDYILLASLRVVITYNTHNHLIIYNVKCRPNLGKLVLIPNRFGLRPRPPLSHHRVARPAASFMFPLYGPWPSSLLYKPYSPSSIIHIPPPFTTIKFKNFH